MALKDIFTMIKADRYTADGCEEIKKAQEAIAEDAGLPDGTMRHRKDGDYIKQAGKWVPAKKGNGGAKKPEEKRKFDQRKYGTSPAAKEDAIRASIVERMTPEQREAVMNGRTLRTVKEGQGVIDITKEDLEFFDKHNAERKPTESKPAAGSGSAPSESASKAPKPSVQEYMKAKDRVKAYEDQYKKEMDDYEYMERLRGNGVDTSIFNPMYGGKPKPLEENKSYMEELNKIKAYESQDSAPRVLTGDCKIRIRKSK